jgi:cbb3-type cytochrome oxidase cytochrome c subunit
LALYECKKCGHRLYVVSDLQRPEVFLVEGCKDCARQIMDEYFKKGLSYGKSLQSAESDKCKCEK